MKSVTDIDKGFINITKQVKKIGGYEIKVGLFDEGDSPKNNLAYRGYVHEFGTRNIPKRPFLRQTVDRNEKNYINLSKKLTSNLGIKETADKMAKDIGEEGKQDVKTTINLQNFTPLSARTVKAKGHPTILIDSKDMYNAITYKIEKGK